MVSEYHTSIKVTDYDPRIYGAYLVSLGSAGRVDAMHNAANEYYAKKGYSDHIKETECFVTKTYDRTERALACYQELVRHKETRPEHKLTAYREQVGLALKLKQLDQAETVAREGVAAFPASPDLRFMLGHVHYRRGQFTDAVDAYQKGFSFMDGPARKPAHLYALLYLGDAYRQIGQNEDALRTYRSLQALPNAQYQQLAIDRIKDLQSAMQR